MLHVATLVIVALAVVISIYSGSMLLALAAISGACGVAALLTASASAVAPRAVPVIRNAEQGLPALPWSENNP